jgi:hypothetical protein
MMEKTLATGAELNADTWADFVARLKHDCEGDGVRRHYTADAEIGRASCRERVFDDV